MSSPGHEIQSFFTSYCGSEKRRGLSLLDFSSPYPPLENLSTGNTNLGQEWKAPIGPYKSKLSPVANTYSSKNDSHM